MLEKERILLYHAKDSAGAPKEELVLNINTECERVGKDERRAPVRVLLCVFVDVRALILNTYILINSEHIHPEEKPQQKNKE